MQPLARSLACSLSHLYQEHLAGRIRLRAWAGRSESEVSKGELSKGEVSKDEVSKGGEGKGSEGEGSDSVVSLGSCVPAHAHAP